MAKIGRNTACPCGSGKKYKKCCLTKENSQKEFIDADLIKRYVKKDGSLKCVQGAFDGIKMSEIILDFSSELLDKADSIKDKRAAIEIAIHAWNFSFLDEEECDHLLLKFSKKKNFKEGDQEVIMLLKALIEKKHFEYPNIDRFIVDYKLIRRGNDMIHLNVVSTAPEK